jgi:hypothetical protein
MLFSFLRRSSRGFAVLNVARLHFRKRSRSTDVAGADQRISRARRPHLLIGIVGGWGLTEARWDVQIVRQVLSG